MQFHLNGFRSGDPRQADPVSGRDGRVDRPSDVDVLIVGCGPAGLTLAAQLSAFADITTRIVELKPGPLEVGQADGVACRSMEMFEAFGIAERVSSEAYRVNEVSFWRPDSDGRIHRADRIQDVEDDLSEMPHVILNQARVHDFLLDVMKSSPRRLVPDYDHRLVSLVRSDDDDEYPIVAEFDGQPCIRARYVVGCDGARSTVRRQLGLELEGEAARQLWGVMDVLAVTDFPDIRVKCAIQSSDAGSMLIIPREGGYLVRMYIELDELGPDERARDRDVDPEGLIEKARSIFAPYRLDVKEIAWWSAYEIGQRVCDSFADSQSDPRIFIAGDACHTHSPKAGQGMNVSMADSFNLGWKLASVCRGRAKRELLGTYSVERQAKARELIDFDRDMARLFSEKPTTETEADEFQRYFQKFGRYTAGVETRYDPSIITSAAVRQELATGLRVGMRFHSAPVVRVADANPMQLGHVLDADGRWRLLAFGSRNDRGQPSGLVAQLCRFLGGDPESPVRRHTAPDEDIDAVIDVRAIFQSGHRELELDHMPSLLLPRKGALGLIDYEKIFAADTTATDDIFDRRGIDRAAGALVVVRPDQYIAAVFGLDEHQDLGAFFDRILLEPPRSRWRGRAPLSG